MKRFWETAEFRAKQERWYAKLKRTGFVDIEKNYCSPENDLRKARMRDYKAVQGYYSAARSFVHEGKFKSNLHLRIWRLHAEGATLRAIEKKTGIPKSTAAVIVDHYREAAGISGEKRGRD